MTNLGYAAAVVSCLASGSYAVPIKGRMANRVNIDPLVMQTYKTIAFVVLSWMLTMMRTSRYNHQHHNGNNKMMMMMVWTPWGILSGLAWVPGASAGIYAIRNAGLAISKGIWSTIKVAVALFWGLLIFHERVRSIPGTMISAILLMMGLGGMCYLSTYRDDNEDDNEDHHHDQTLIAPEEEEEDARNYGARNYGARNYGARNYGARNDRHDDDSHDNPTEVTEESTGGKTNVNSIDNNDDPCHGRRPRCDTNTLPSRNTPRPPPIFDEEWPKVDGMDHDDDDDDDEDDDHKSTSMMSSTSREPLLGRRRRQRRRSVPPPPDPAGRDDRPLCPTEVVTIRLCGSSTIKISWQRRTYGMIAACFDGVWGGSLLVPMHYARAHHDHDNRHQEVDPKGLDYVWSFATGAAIVLSIAWICRYTYNVLIILLTRNDVAATMTTMTTIADHHPNRSLFSSCCYFCCCGWLYSVGDVMSMACHEGWTSLPSFHWGVMWFPGMIVSGGLWTVGMISSTVAVAELGMGIGYSLVQSQLLVAGLWGLLYYREVNGPPCHLVMWFGCAIVALAGILLLSYERPSST